MTFTENIHHVLRSNPDVDIFMNKCGYRSNDANFTTFTTLRNKCGFSQQRSNRLAETFESARIGGLSLGILQKGVKNRRSRIQWPRGLEYVVDIYTSPVATEDDVAA